MNKKGKVIILTLIIITIIVAVIFIVRNNKSQENATTVEDANSKVEAMNGDTAKETADSTEQEYEHSHEGEEQQEEELALTEIADANSKKEIPGTKQFEAYEINSLTLYLKDGESTLIGKIKNTSNEVTPEIPINLTFVDENEAELIELEAVIVELGPGQETELNTSVDEDIMNAVDFKITKSPTE